MTAKANREPSNAVRRNRRKTAGRSSAHPPKKVYAVEYPINFQSSPIGEDCP
jgi:hypothetical protein